MTTTMTPRASAEVAAEIATRRARQEELATRHATVTAAIVDARAERARAIADGESVPNVKALTALIEEQTGLAAGLALIAEDLTRLASESATVAIEEAEQADADAVTEAMEKAAALDAALRSAFVSSVAPAFDAFNTALRTARAADDVLDRLRRVSNPEALEVRGKAERVLDRRMALLSTITTVRSFVDSHRER